MGIPCLPPIGGSSFDATAIELGGDAEPVGLVAHKFELQYTCKICETRNSHNVTRLAYRKGLVITFCKGCDAKHLIADNLGWTGQFNNGDTSIEDYYETVGRGDEVNRVSKDVYDLEQNLYTGADGVEDSRGDTENGKAFE